MQRGGFESEQAATEALERVLEQLRREQGLVESPTLAELVDIYLAQHEGEPETTEKLRWLLAKAVLVFGERSLTQLRSPAIASWRMTIPAGHRFEATQALRQVLARAVSWGLLDINPAKLGVENPQRRYTEKRSFDSWEQLYTLTDKLPGRYRPMVLFAAATGLRPGEWLALEHRDIDRQAQVVYVRRTLRNGRVKPPKTKASVRAVPLQAIALTALDQLPRDKECALLFPSPRGGHLDLHNFRNRSWTTAQKAARIAPLRRVYDLRHTFATFALRAGVSTFDLSRYMGTSLAMIDRHYGHLARDGREHAIKLLDTYRAAEALDVHQVVTPWTPNEPFDLNAGDGNPR
ncbi:MAG TPA: site-specific integrase [Thermoleophilaceae bacterium]